MKARGYLVRIDASALDEMYIGLDALIADPMVAVAGAISDIQQCTADTAARRAPACPNPLAGLFAGWAHTHLWINGTRVFLPSGTEVVVSPPEVALEPEPHL